jgi:dTDP-4-amino-4,6-dideoxygalactose transaminase
VIPRLRPEFSLADLLRALRTSRADVATELGARLSRECAFWVPSGRAGLMVGLRAVGATKAIVPAFNCWAVMEALRCAGVEPVFVDIGDDLNADIDQAAAALERAEKGTAFILTHQFGIPARGSAALISIARRRGVPVIEDAAGAFGAESDAGPVGSAGDISVFSFQYTKTVFSGEGGLLLTGADLGARVSDLRSIFQPCRFRGATGQWLKLVALTTFTHPWVYRWTIYPTIPAAGTANERGAAPMFAPFRVLPSRWMKALAAMTLVRSRSVLDARRRIAMRYLEAFAQLPVRAIPAIAAPTAAPIRFPLLVEKRSDFVARCARDGLDLGRSFGYTCSTGGFPAAERVAANVVNVPLSVRLEPHVPAIIKIVSDATRD